MRYPMSDMHQLCQEQGYLLFRPNLYLHVDNSSNMTPRNKHLLLNWVFLPCLLVLALNDHFLKYGYPGWLTGKLSDFAGLLIFPLFLAYLLSLIHI